MYMDIGKNCVAKTKTMRPDHAISIAATSTKSRYAGSTSNRRREQQKGEIRFY